VVITNSQDRRLGRWFARRVVKSVEHLQQDGTPRGQELVEPLLAGGGEPPLAA
jgi:hypothetical protein